MNKQEHHLRFKIEKSRINGVFEIMNDTIVNVSLVQLIDTVRNVNNEVSMFGKWIFDSNYKKTSIYNRIIEYGTLLFVWAMNICHV